MKGYMHVHARMGIAVCCSTPLLEPELFVAFGQITFA